MVLQPLLLAILLFISPGEPRLVLRERHESYTTDNLGNIYIVRDAELLKYNPAGRRLARYSNLKLGAISGIDATNSLKLLVYYRDYQQIVFLDNQLSPNGQAISLQELGLEQAHLACASANNSFWVYDRRNNELLRFDQGAKKIAATGNLKQVLNEEISPAEITEHNNSLFLVTPSVGVHVFDIYGAFSKFIPLPQLSGVQVKNEVMYYMKDGRFCSYDLTRFDQKCEEPVLGARRCRVDAGMIYTSFGDSLVVSPI